MSDDTLILLDGTAAAYRAFYAIRDLSTTRGRPTNAVFGFVRILKHLRERWNPTHWAVVFDGGVPEERRQLLEEYKAQRPGMPEALREQLPVMDDYLDRAGIAHVRCEGQEADDVIASMVESYAERVSRILISTSDKDMYQLAGERVQIVPPAGSGSAMGPAEIMAKTGVAPSQIVAWLALVGDQSDNIPGVPGVGPKTATGLLAQWPDLETLWAHLDDVSSERIRTALREHRQTVTRNVAMVRLRTNLEFGIDWEDMVLRAPDAERLLPLFDELEFTAMARELREPELFA